MARWCVVLVLMLSCGWAIAQDNTSESEAQRVADAYAHLAAAQKAAPATRPTGQQLEIQKLKQEIVQLQDQVEELKAENYQLRQQLGLPEVVKGKPRTDYEQRMTDLLSHMQWSVAARNTAMAKAAVVDKALNAWCATHSPDDATANALWAEEVEIGMPWDGVAIIGTSALESESADGQVYKFIPFFDTAHTDIIAVQEGKIVEIRHETR